MLGAIAGDIIGSPFEITNLKSAKFLPLFQRGSCFTDDSVLTLATADVLLCGGSYSDAQTGSQKSFRKSGIFL